MKKQYYTKNIWRLINKPKYNTRTTWNWVILTKEQVEANRPKDAYDYLF